MKFGNHIKLSRERRQVGLRELAGLIGVSPAYISRVEHGTLDPTEDVVVRWAAVLGEDPDYLMALLGRIRSDLIEQIRLNPDLYGQLLSSLRGLGAGRVEQVLQAAREVKEGNW